MILVAVSLLAVLSVPLCGGRLGRLSAMRLRWLWLPLLAVAVQVVITVVVPQGSPALHRDLHMATYVAIGVFLWANRRIAGMSIVAAGATLNALAIAANDGVMPASASAERLSGLRLRAGFDNSAHLAGARLPWLGDVIPWPGPLHNVLSIGDLLIFAGLLVVLHRACTWPRSGAPVQVPDPDSALELEADPHLDLEVGDLAVLHVTADRSHLDPVEVAQRL